VSVLVPPGGQLAPPPGCVDYTGVLRGAGATPARSVMGMVLALAGYALLVPLALQGMLAVSHTLSGDQSSFADYYRRAVAFELPAGLVASHLALALLIPVVFAVVRWVHWRDVRWLHSVQPGLRWRYLLACGLAAVVVLNGVLWLSQAGSGWHYDPQQRVWLWLGLIVLTSPLQAAAEEYFFRGYLIQAMGSMLTNRWVAVVATALVFALFHGVQNTALFVDRFGFGLLAGALVVFTGGIEAGIAAHVVNNIFAFGYAALGGGVSQVRGVRAITWTDAAFDLLGFLLVGLVSWWIARRMNLATRTPDERDLAADRPPGRGPAASV